MGLFTRTQQMGAAALLLAASVFLSRFMGLLRDKIISYYYGASLESDIYFTAFVLPDFVNYLLAGGYFSITLIPLLASRFATSEEDGWRLFSSIFWWVCMASLALVSIAWLGAPFFVKLIAPGFPPDAQERLVFFLRIILPAQIFFLPGACLTALLYLRQQFIVPALTPLLYNGCIIGMGLLGLYFYPDSGMLGFCWGVPLGALLGSLILPLLATSAHGGLRLAKALWHPAVRTFLLLALPLMLGQSIVALDEQFIRLFGSLTGEGGVSQLNYARRIMLVPVGVVAQAAGVASYPFLARLVAANAKERFSSTLRTAMQKALLVSIPLSIWMIIAAQPLISLIFEQGAFSNADSVQTTLLLRIMLLAVALWTIQQLIGRAFYAHQNTLTPALTGTIITGLSLPLYWLGALQFGTLGVALAGLCSILAYTICLGIVWARAHSGAVFYRMGWEMLRLTLCAAPAAIGAYYSLLLIPLAIPPLLRAFLQLSCSGTVFVLLYIAVGYAFLPSLREELEKIRLKKK